MSTPAFYSRMLLVASTDRIAGAQGCRTPKDDRTVVLDGHEATIEELGYYCRYLKWPEDTDALTPVCGRPGCVMHLAYADEEAELLQLVADYRPQKSLADAFRDGRRKGFFRSSGYAG